MYQSMNMSLINDTLVRQFSGAFDSFQLTNKDLIKITNH